MGSSNLASTLSFLHWHLHHISTKHVHSPNVQEPQLSVVVCDLWGPPAQCHARSKI